MTLDGNGGMVDGNSTKVHQIAYGASFDQSAILKYYTFDGWYSSPTGGTKYNDTGNIIWIQMLPCMPIGPAAQALLLIRIGMELY
ncbi:MAG: InlB B-repeat-containing protein [Hungatella sp.]|nr:InlB B-repeat-containing protein [Hungatella sp.]